MQKPREVFGSYHKNRDTRGLPGRMGVFSILSIMKKFACTMPENRSDAGVLLFCTEWKAGNLCKPSGGFRDGRYKDPQSFWISL